MPICQGCLSEYVENNGEYCSENCRHWEIDRLQRLKEYHENVTRNYPDYLGECEDWYARLVEKLGTL